MVQLTETQKTLVDQLQTQNRLFKYEYNVKAFLTIKDGIRLHTKQKQTVVNIDITYNYGTDLYIIKAYKLNRKSLEAELIGDFNGVYFDQLHQVIRSILFKEEGF